MTELEHRIRVVRPAFEKRHDDPAKDYGIGCVMLAFELFGGGRGITLEVFTGWFLPHVAERLRRESPHRKSSITDEWSRCSLEGHGGAVYWHYSEPPEHLLEYQPQPDTGDCPLTGGKCWTDVGYLAGDEAFGVLVAEGEDGLWKHLEALLRG